MSLPLILHPDIHPDIKSHRDWYREISADLGEEFRNSLIATFDQIQQFPQMYAEVEDGIRRASLIRFPYQVFYHPAANCTYVLGLYHSHANPQSTLERVANRKPSGSSDD